MPHLTKLHLTDFRCYDSAVIDDVSSGAIVLYGPNGAGKTNVLEAVSLLTPGRGLRGARIPEIQRAEMSPSRNGWAVSATAETFYGSVKIGTGRDVETDKRVVRINGEPAKSQAALAEYLSVVWLTPQMDGLFIDSAGARRRFLDRLVFAFDPGHAGRVTRYENAMAQRAKILKEQERPDSTWLEGLEKGMAETGVAVAAARLELVRRLQKSCDSVAPEDGFYFPRARVGMLGTVEELLSRVPAVEAEEMFRYQLRETRERDAQTGGAATGPHRSDLSVFHAEKDMPAAQGSTGEQKALLIGLILAHARLIAAERGAPPILLLDEVAAHLDEDRRAGLYRILNGLGGQVWLTGTDAALFDRIGEGAQFMEVREARIAAVDMSRAA